jgi:hypothetical protein
MYVSLYDCRAARARITVVPAQHSWVALPRPFVTSLQGMEVQRPLVIRLTVTSAVGKRDHAVITCSRQSNQQCCCCPPDHFRVPAEHAADALADTAVFMLPRQGKEFKTQRFDKHILCATATTM